MDKGYINEKIMK